MAVTETAFDLAQCERDFETLVGGDEMDDAHFANLWAEALIEEVKRLRARLANPRVRQALRDQIVDRYMAGDPAMIAALDKRFPDLR